MYHPFGPELGKLLRTTKQDTSGTPKDREPPRKGNPTKNRNKPRPTNKS